MARKDTLDLPLFTRMRSQFETTDAEVLLEAASDDLFAFVREAPLLYGFWGDFKRLFKAAENATPVAPTAALLARLDTADLPCRAASARSTNGGESIRSVGGVRFDGTRAYVLNHDWNSQGVCIVDLTHPALPVVAGVLRERGLADLAVAGNRLYLLQGTSWNQAGRLSCFDIADPGNPRPEGVLDFADGRDIAVSGTLIAVLISSSPNSGIQLIDAAVPGALRLLGHLPLLCPIAIQIVGSTAYILDAGTHANRVNTLQVVDLSDPQNPRVQSEVESLPALELAIQGRYAYLTCGSANGQAPDDQSGLAVVDLGGPDSPRPIAFLALGNVRHIAVQGRYAYVSVARSSSWEQGTGGLRIVDIGDPAHPQLVGSFRTDDAGSVQVSGSTVGLTVLSGLDHDLRMLDVSDPTRPLLLGAAPSPETLGYMKRRGRRLLRALAVQDPETYVQIAAQMLVAAGQAQPVLDPRTQWISMDLLYGGGTRYAQQAHGRGAYRAPHPVLSLRSREERCPEIWDRHPELVVRLYTTPNLPWPTWEAACKMLRSTNRPLPRLNPAMQADFLASQSPLLRSVAIRQIVASLNAGRKASAQNMADAYLLGTRRHRQQIERFLAAQESDLRWDTAFALRLNRVAGIGVRDNALPRKARLSFTLLVARFPTLFGREILSEVLTILYRTGAPNFTGWSPAVLRDLLPSQLPEWLYALLVLPTETRETAAEAVLAGFAAKEIPADILRELTRHPYAWVRETGWRILAHSRTPLADIARAWTGLLDSGEPTEELLTAFASPDALRLFGRCEFDSAQMAVRLQVHRYLMPMLPSAALEKIVTVLNSAAVLRLVADATESQWPGLRTALLLGPLLPERRAAFWREAFAFLSATGSAPGARRLLEDVTMQATLLELTEIGDLLTSANPVFGPILGQWVTAHSTLLRRDSAELLQIATHALPEIRSVGLNRVRQIGMGLPFALRLMESELPPSVAVGKTFFESLDPVDSLRPEAITALCDSPKPSVRTYGRHCLTARPGMLAETDVLARLSENPDPETQAFVAAELLAKTVTTAAVEGFDRAVLRTRDRGRRAKELVKARLDAQPTPDVALLLEMARSRTPRDADWALGQLAKLALAGVEIPGFTLDGVAGG